MSFAWILLTKYLHIGFYKNIMVVSRYYAKQKRHLIIAKTRIVKVGQ